MSEIGNLVSQLIDMGVSAPEAAEIVARAAIAGAAQRADPMAEKRRAWDRDRQRRRRADNHRTPVESGGHTVDTAPLESKAPPKPPLKTQSPEPPSPPKGGSIPRLVKPNGFSRFWEAYPRKVGKRAAELAYDRAMKRVPGHDPPAEIMAGLNRAKADPKWREEPEFIPHPTTWLNQDRWLDGLEAPPEPPSPEEIARQAQLREQMIEHALERAATH